MLSGKENGRPPEMLYVNHAFRKHIAVYRTRQNNKQTNTETPKFLECAYSKNIWKSYCPRKAVSKVSKKDFVFEKKIFPLKTQFHVDMESCRFR